MSLREKALRAYQLEQGRNEQEKAVLHATQTERTAKAFREMFGVEPDGVTIDDVVIEDLRLRAQYDKGEFRCFQLQGDCPTCGKACYSQGVSSLADLGRMLEDFIPTYFHQCPGESPPSTAEDHLVEALRELISEIAFQ